MGIGNKINHGSYLAGKNNEKGNVSFPIKYDIIKLNFFKILTNNTISWFYNNSLIQILVYKR